MARRLLALLPIALAVVAAVTFPVTTSAAPRDDPPATCTKDTRAVTGLVDAVTAQGTALGAKPVDPAKVGQAAGDLFTAVTAAQTAGCLPALPSTPAAAPPAAGAAATTGCAAPTVGMLSASLGEIMATSATPPNPRALFAAAGKLVGSIAAVNAHKCLPVALPVPKPAAVS